MALSSKAMDQAGRILLPLAAVACLIPAVSSAAALLLGIAVALTVGNPYLAFTRKVTPKLMAYAIIGLGAGMDLIVVGRVGLQGIGYTVIGISLTYLLGMSLAKLLKIRGDTGLLVTTGTAICGGSAIAALAPAISAKTEEVSVALATVFCLNALALVIFPPLGHLLEMSQGQFGLWCALAIHDTSSVVGSAMQFGPEALAIGTTVKLARALWIVPVVWVISTIREHHTKSAAVEGSPVIKAKKPWFILGFLAVAAVVTFIPALKEPGEFVALVARRGLVVTLFLIGANLTKATLKSVGVRPLAQGVALWLTVSSVTLAAILAGWIHP